MSGLGAGGLVSIHAPVKGATAQGRFVEAANMGFNPRTREGCDYHYERHHLGHVVSIHAPVKGATGAHLPPAVPVAVSIHAPVKGATVLGFIFGGFGKFQSTHP